MNEKDRLKALVKLMEAKDECQWTITHLEESVPYANDDISKLGEAKKHIMSVRGKLEEPYPPDNPITKTKYPLFDVGFMMGAVPWDIWALNLPYTANFTRENWEEGANLMAQHGVNAVRFFLTGTENAGDLDRFLMPFKRVGKKFDMTELGGEIDEILWRLEKFWERDITTMICVASGIKGKGFEHTVWHGRHNVNETTEDHRRFMTNDKTNEINAKVISLLCKVCPKDKAIIEGINEPLSFSTVERYNYHRFIMNYCKSLGLKGKHMAFQKWDSGCCHDLLKEFDCWMMIHAMNCIDHMKVVHKASMQREYFNEFYFVATNSDGTVKDYPGHGLIGKAWGKSLRKAAPLHILEMLKFDYKNSGAGCMFMSAGAYYKNLHNDKPNFRDWEHTNVGGLTRDECKEQGVDWSLFSYRKLLKQYPLGELVAIRKAAEELFGG